METQPNTEEARLHSLALELWNGIEERSHWPALPHKTIAMTLERYEGDELGAAMAADLTHALVPELPFDGTVDTNEAEPIDGLVEILRNSGLSGVTIEELADALSINLDMGAMDGLMTMHAMLSDASLGNVALLRKRFAISDVAREHEDNEFEEFVAHQTDSLNDDLDMPDDAWDDEESEEEAIEFRPNILKDESGEEFEI